jgi:hypothetical protein
MFLIHKDKDKCRAALTSFGESLEEIGCGEIQYINLGKLWLA